MRSRTRRYFYGVDGSEAHMVARHGLGDRRGSRDGVFACHCLCVCLAAKAAEAAASGHAYYDPVNPHRVYMPGAPPQYTAETQQSAAAAAPPPYSEATKKND